LVGGFGHLVWPEDFRWVGEAAAQPQSRTKASVAVFPHSRGLEMSLVAVQGSLQPLLCRATLFRGESCWFGSEKSAQADPTAQCDSLPQDE